MTRGIPLLLCSICACGLQADQVTLENGDRITGKIITSDSKTLTIKTDAMGDVKIDRAAVEALVRPAA